MRGKIILQVLEILKDGTVDFITMQEAILKSGYGATSGRIQYEVRKIKRDRGRRTIESEEKIKILGRYRTMLSKLKRDGLIQNEGRGRLSLLNITSKGLAKLKVLKRQKKFLFPAPIYEKEKGDQVIIVIFDIPESEKSKRNWLRSVLKNLNFEMVQKSVWIGKTKIPKLFLEDLGTLKIIEFVEIFEVSKTGSLRNVT